MGVGFPVGEGGGVGDRMVGAELAGGFGVGVLVEVGFRS